MTIPLPEERAKQECEKLITSLDSDKGLIVAKGAMYGVLVCKNSDGKEIVLRAFSGMANGIPNREGWVPPLFDVEKYNKVLEENKIKMSPVARKVVIASSSVAKTIAMKDSRRRLQLELSKNLFDLYRFPCIDGTVKTFSDVYPGYKDGRSVPEEGTGDCCAPKLFGYAYSNKLTPVSFAEFYYNSMGRDSQLKHKQFASVCDERCDYILPEMIGSNVVYCDSDIVVINKKSDVSSKDAAACLCKLLPKCIKNPESYELNKETSGLYILSLNSAAQKNIAEQYEAGEIKEQYTGMLRGKLDKSESVEPNQTSGKINNISWTKLKGCKVRKAFNAPVPTEFATYVQFVPEIAGATEDIRKICADKKGLGLPLVGDGVYGEKREGEHLVLQVSRIEFKHPATNKKLIIECPLRTK